MTASSPTTQPPPEPTPTPALALVPFVILTAVFLIQLFTAHTTELTPWKGGGFGMFSTVDMDSQRITVLSINFDGEETVIDIPPSLQPQIERLRSIPTTARTEALAEDILVRARRAERPENGGQQRRVDGVRLQIWALSFDAHHSDPGGELSRHKIQDVFVPGEP